MNKFLGVWSSSLLVGALIIPVVAFAAQVRVGDQPMVGSAEKIAQNVYMAGGQVSQNGAITGDLVAAGGNLLVSGTVSRDVLVAGGSITAVNTIGGNVRVAGGNITLTGKVGGDVLAAGGQIEISGAGVGGDVIVGGGTVQIDAPVSGSVRIAGGTVTINAPVSGDVYFKGNKLTLGSNAVVGGNLDYSARTEATMETGAVVKGTTTYSPQKTTPGAPQLSVGAIAAIVSLVVLWKFLATLVFALVLGLLLRRFTLSLVRGALAQPLLEAGRGLIVLIVLPIVSILLLVSLLGVPLGILGLVSFVALMLVASALSAIIMGSLVHKWIFKPAEYRVSWQTILLGVFVYTLIGFIPVLGGIVKFVFVLLALGTMVKIKWDVLKEWR